MDGISVSLISENIQGTFYSIFVKYTEGFQVWTHTWKKVMYIKETWNDFNSKNWWTLNTANNAHNDVYHQQNLSQHKISHFVSFVAPLKAVINHKIVKIRGINIK